MFETYAVRDYTYRFDGRYFQVYDKFGTNVGYASTESGAWELIAVLASMPIK